MMTATVFILHLLMGATIWSLSLPWKSTPEPWDTGLFGVTVVISLVLGFVQPKQQISSIVSAWLGMWLGQMAALYFIAKVEPKAWLTLYWVSTSIAALLNAAAITGGQEFRRLTTVRH